MLVSARSRYGAFAVFAVLLAIVLFAVQNVAVAMFFPHLVRVTTDFSEAYLRRQIQWLAQSPPRTIFLGDSVLWGYRLPADATAVADLRAQGCACENLSFKASSPPNYYALVRLMEADGVHPRAVVLEVNQKVLNPADDAYAKLHPAVEALAGPLIDARDRALLVAPATKTSPAARASAILASVWSTYAMRADIRETFVGDPSEATPARRLTSAMFEGTYDVGPLDETNVGVHFLEETADRLRADGVPVVAFMTPTNHQLLHDYIDNPDYAKRAAFLMRILRARGVRVLDLDRAFPQSAFIDEVHLTVPAQRTLATMLAGALPAGSAESGVRARTTKRVDHANRQPLAR